MAGSVAPATDALVVTISILDSSSMMMSIATVQISNREMTVITSQNGDHRVTPEAVRSIVLDKIAGVSFEVGTSRNFGVAKAEG